MTNKGGQKVEREVEDTEEQMEKESRRQIVNKIRSPMLKCTTPANDSTTGGSD